VNWGERRRVACFESFAELVVFETAGELVGVAGARWPIEEAPGPSTPVSSRFEGTLIRLRVEHLPGQRDPKPLWLWSSRTGACHEGCVSHGCTKIGWRDLHAAGKGSPCESGQQYRRS